MRRAVLIGGVWFALLTPSLAPAADWGPWAAAPTAAPTRPASELNLLKSGVRFFQRFVSPVDGPRCPLYPTCSHYALQSLDRHGPLVGTLLTVDRLLRESDPAEHRRPHRFADRLRYADPLSENDFWLAGAVRAAP